MRRASVIIPAYDEETTIVPIIRAAQSHPWVSEVIVVSDGSSDKTAEYASQTSAIIVEWKENRGKGEAMDEGVRLAKEDVIVFIDADLEGFTKQMITQLLEPIFRDECDMVTLRRDRPRFMYTKLHPLLDLSGERAMKKEIWSKVPADLRRGFYIEAAINACVLEHGYRARMLLAPGLTSWLKEAKHGLLRGSWERIRMLSHLCDAYTRIAVRGMRRHKRQASAVELP